MISRIYQRTISSNTKYHAKGPYRAGMTGRDDHIRQPQKKSCAQGAHLVIACDVICAAMLGTSRIKKQGHHTVCIPHVLYKPSGWD
eukprot:1149498-Pelagomonas_calceolata.AAC.3